MQDMSDLFGDPPKKGNNKVGLAMVLRLLAEMLDSNEESTDSAYEPEEKAEVLTRPHFTPSGG